jgi:phosphate transport system permease protein
MTRTRASLRRDRYRQVKSKFMVGLTVGATVLALIPLFLVLGYLLSKGFTSLNWDFFTKMPVPVRQSGGGMANAIIGTFWLVGVATMIGVPIGVASGIYMAENPAAYLATAVRFAADVTMGIPTIVVGIFVYEIVVRPFGGFSALAGSIALAIIMIPLVARTSEEMILLVPQELREASLALGVPRWRSTLLVATRTAMRGIATGVILAIARVAGETAPLLFTAFGNRFWSASPFRPISSLTVQVYTYAMSPYADWQRQAWAGALVLTVIVLALELSVRSFTRSSARVAG